MDIKKPLLPSIELRTSDERTIDHGDLAPAGSEHISQFNDQNHRKDRNPTMKDADDEKEDHARAKINAIMHQQAVLAGGRSRPHLNQKQSPPQLDDPYQSNNDDDDSDDADDYANIETASIVLVPTNEAVGKIPPPGHPAKASALSATSSSTITSIDPKVGTREITVDSTLSPQDSTQCKDKVCTRIKLTHSLLENPASLWKLAEEAAAELQKNKKHSSTRLIDNSLLNKSPIQQPKQQQQQTQEQEREYKPTIPIKPSSSSGQLLTPTPTAAVTLQKHTLPKHIVTPHNDKFPLGQSGLDFDHVEQSLQSDVYMQADKFNPPHCDIPHCPQPNPPHQHQSLRVALQALPAPKSHGLSFGLHELTLDIPPPIMEPPASHHPDSSLVRHHDTYEQAREAVNQMSHPLHDDPLEDFDYREYEQHLAMSLLHPIHREDTPRPELSISEDCILYAHGGPLPARLPTHPAPSLRQQTIQPIKPDDHQSSDGDISDNALPQMDQLSSHFKNTVTTTSPSNNQHGNCPNKQEMGNEKYLGTKLTDQKRKPRSSMMTSSHSLSRPASGKLLPQPPTNQSIISPPHASVNSNPVPLKKPNKTLPPHFHPHNTDPSLPSTPCHEPHFKEYFQSPAPPCGVSTELISLLGNQRNAVYHTDPISTPGLSDLTPSPTSQSSALPPMFPQPSMMTPPIQLNSNQLSRRPTPSAPVPFDSLQHWEQSHRNELDTTMLLEKHNNFIPKNDVITSALPSSNLKHQSLVRYETGLFSPPPAAVRSGQLSKRTAPILDALRNNYNIPESIPTKPQLMGGNLPPSFALIEIDSEDALDKINQSAKMTRNLIFPHRFQLLEDCNPATPSTAAPSAFTSVHTTPSAQQTCSKSTSPLADVEDNA